MKSFTQDQQENINTQVKALAEAEAALFSEVEEFNKALNLAIEKVEKSKEAYNDCLLALREVYEVIANEARNYYDEQTDKWQQSAEGSAYDNWCNDLENVDLEYLDIDFPEELPEPDFVDLESLPPSEPSD